MNKITQSVVFAFALPMLMIASTSFASQCDLSSISQDTSNCLINEANTAFQNNYQAELNQLNSNSNSSTQSTAGNFSSSENSFMSSPAPVKEPALNAGTENNNTVNQNNNVSTDTKSSIRWF